MTVALGSIQRKIAINEALRYFVGQTLILAPLEYMLRRKYLFAKCAKGGNDIFLILRKLEFHEYLLSIVLNSSRAYENAINFTRR